MEEVSHGRSASGFWLLGDPHFVFQLVLSVDLVLRDIEVVGGVVVNRVCAPAKMVQEAVMKVVGEFGGGFPLPNSQLVEQIRLWR